MFKKFAVALIAASMIAGPVLAQAPAATPAPAAPAKTTAAPATPVKQVKQVRHVKKGKKAKRHFARGHKRMHVKQMRHVKRMKQVRHVKRIKAGNRIISKRIATPAVSAAKTATPVR